MGMAPILLIFLKINDYTGKIIGGVKCTVAHSTKILGGHSASDAARDSTANNNVDSMLKVETGWKANIGTSGESIAVSSSPI